MNAVKNVAYYLDVTLAYIKMSFMTIIEYPSSIIGWLLSNPIQFVLGFATIKYVVAEFGNINGWGYGALAFLYGISVISHALSMIFFVMGWFMGYAILEGDLDRMLTRPMSVVYQYFFNNINIFGVTDLVPGIIVFIYGCIKINFVWNLKSIILLLALIIGATLIRGGIYMIIGSTSFWTRSANDFGQFCQEIFDKTTLYPISMYPESVQFILTYLIPIGWVSFYPVSSLLGIEANTLSDWSAAGITLLIGIITITIAAFIFNQGLKKYESAGN